jgi:WD40 repeat protein
VLLCPLPAAGDFLVSCSMDHSAKLWDLTAQKCRQSMRGHVDSVNSVCFQPFSNHLCTGSGDKTVSLWDMRTALCVQTFYGHRNAINHVAFSLKVDF